MHHVFQVAVDMYESARQLSAFLHTCSRMQKPPICTSTNRHQAIIGKQSDKQRDSHICVQKDQESSTKQGKYMQADLHQALL